MKRITIKEIAKRAGVSVGTVDRVLHNRGEVAESTKELVLKIAKEGSYTTNVFARNLKLNKTYRIAVILPLDNEYWEIQRQGIELSAREYEPLGMSLRFYPFDRSNQGSFLNKATLAIDDAPDAVILAPLMEKEATDICMRIKEKGIPFVFVDSNLKEVSPLAFIGQDSVQSGYLAAKLLNYGYEQGYISYIVKYTDFDSFNKAIDERISGFRKYYEDNHWGLSLIKEVDILDQEGLIDLLKKAKEESVHIFIPNSRAHKIVSMVGQELLNKKRRMIGFDLIRDNVSTLENNAVDFIIDQNPHLQGELSVQTLYKHLMGGETVKNIQFMPIEIVSKENLEFANSYFEEGIPTSS